MRQINFQASMAFVNTAVGKISWIGTIGPHWRYSEKEDNQDPRPLIWWHHIINDQPSYCDLTQLADLVAYL